MKRLQATAGTPPHVETNLQQASSASRTLLGAMLRRWRTDQSGATLTEFVICLPVFVLLFVGINELHKAMSGTISGRISAYSNMWDNALPVQKDLISFTHQSPQIAAAVGGAQILSDPSPYPVADGLLGASYIGLGIGGTRRESRVLQMAGAVGSLSPTTLFTPPPETTFFARDVNHDVWPDFISPATGLNVFWYPFTLVPPTSFVVPHQTLAAGIRYGQERGTASGSINTAFGTIPYDFQYDVMVAPRPVTGLGPPEFTPIAFSRTMADEHECFESLLGIEWEVRHMGCDFDMTPLYTTSYLTPPF